MRIVGVDRVPLDAVRARRGAAQAGADRRCRCAPARPSARSPRRGMVEAVTWSFIRKPQAELFGGGQAGACARQSDRGRPLRHAAEPHSGPRRRGAEERRPRLCRRRRCSRSGRSSRATSRRISSPPPPACAARSRKAAGVGRHWSAPTAEVDAFDVKADALAVLAAAGAPAQALQVVPGGPAWLHPGRSGTIQIGPQNVLGYFGELHPRALEALDAEGPLVGLRGDPRAHPRAEGEGRRAPSRRSSCRRSSRSTRDFAFVVDAQGEGRRHRARRAERRPQADRRRHACSTSTRARASSRARSRSPSR